MMSKAQKTFVLGMDIPAVLSLYLDYTSAPEVLEAFEVCFKKRYADAEDNNDDELREYWGTAYKRIVGLLAELEMIHVKHMAPEQRGAYEKGEN